MKKRRNNGAKKHRDWTLDPWKSVLGSDESKFLLPIAVSLSVAERVSGWNLRVRYHEA